METIAVDYLSLQDLQLLQTRPVDISLSLSDA